MNLVDNRNKKNESWIESLLLRKVKKVGNKLFIYDNYSFSDDLISYVDKNSNKYHLISRYLNNIKKTLY